jgi:hypothetical protein
MTHRLLISLGVLCVFCGKSTAAPPTIESVTPAVGQRGTEFTLNLYGAGLTDPQELLFYTPGVTCTKLVAASENRVTATLAAATDCRLGEYTFRLRAAGGISEVRVVRITPFPVVMEQEPNDSLKQAQPVPLNVSVAGVIEAAGTDCFSVTLKKGQRLAAEVEGVRLGGELTDTVLTVFGPDGRELASVDDTPLFHQDPFLTVIAPADGVYVVQVRETNYGGGDNNRYVLHIGSFLRPAAVYPAGGPAGTEVSVRLLGDAGGERTQVVRLPAAGATFEFYPTDGTVPAPTPNPFRVSPFPNVMEVEPNDDPRSATPSPHGWPVAFNGVITTPGDVDHYRFRAVKGDVIEVTAFADRIGSPLDTILAVLDATGAELAVNDDDETHDSRVRLTIPADGKYVVRIADKRKQGGPGFLYRIEVDRPKPGLTVFLPTAIRKSQDRHVITVPRGNRVAAFVGVRRDGFDGPVTISPDQLPAGVVATIPPIPAGEYFVPVVFEASANAPLGGRLVGLTGHGGEPRSPIIGGFRQDVTLIFGPGEAAFHAVTLSKLAVVVVDEGPFTVAISPLAGPLAVDGTFDVTVKATRSPDFAEPIEVTFPCLPPGVEAPTSVVIPADKSEAVVTLVAHPAAEIGAWRLLVEAKPASAARARRDPLAAGAGAAAGGRRPRRTTEGVVPVASAVIPVTVAAAPVAGRFLPAAGEQGQAVKVTCQFDVPPTVAFAAKLDGLPPRATAQPRTVAAGAQQVEFTVTLDATTPAGECRALVCELAGEVGGQKVLYRIGRGAILTVHPPGGAKTDATGKLLSPLDALRLGQKKDGGKDR